LAFRDIVACKSVNSCENIDALRQGLTTEFANITQQQHPF
jgi:hypothetical protein